MRESRRQLTSEDGTMRRDGDNRVRVELLDGEHIMVDVERKARGSDLLDQICDSLDIIEKDYFGLLHTQRGDPRVWVDLNRRLSKTFRNEPWDVRFSVKFYPPEPSELRDDVTRYQLGLAIRRDLMESRLSCSAITYALLASYVLQAELGDRAGKVAPSVLSEHNAAPLKVLTPDMEDNIDELYKKHRLIDSQRDRKLNKSLQKWINLINSDPNKQFKIKRGQTPAEAELNYLENAKKLPLYGAEIHNVKDCEDVDIALAICAAGVSVLRDGVLMNRFPWAKITKISYNKRTFTLRLRNSEFDEFETYLSFKLPSTRASKRLWKSSVEHHMFFRREAPVKVERIVGFPRLGSRRLSCRRTLRQLRDLHNLPAACA